MRSTNENGANQRDLEEQEERSHPNRPIFASPFGERSGGVGRYEEKRCSYFSISGPRVSGSALLSPCPITLLHFSTNDIVRSFFPLLKPLISPIRFIHVTPVLKVNVRFHNVRYALLYAAYHVKLIENNRLL